MKRNKLTKLLILSSVFFILIIFIYPHLSIYITTKYHFNNEQLDAYTVPKKINMKKVNRVKSTTINYDRIKFKTSMRSHEIIKRNNIDIIKFNKNKEIILYKNEMLKEDFKKISSLDGFHKKELFHIMKISLNTTPNNLSLFSPLKEKKRIVTFLFLKSLFTPYGPEIFEFINKNNIKGFLYTNHKEHSPSHVIFFIKDKHPYILKFFNIKPQEIKLILSTIELSE